MPIFEYECRDCKHQFEVITTSSQQNEAVECPECKSTDVTKHMSTSAIRIGSPVRPTRSPASSGGCKPGSGFS